MEKEVIFDQKFTKAYFPDSEIMVDFDTWKKKLKTSVPKKYSIHFLTEDISKNYYKEIAQQTKEDPCGECKETDKTPRGILRLLCDYRKIFEFMKKDIEKNQ